MYVLAGMLVAGFVWNYLIKPAGGQAVITVSTATMRPW
jgi:hypothetical protein